MPHDTRGFPQTFRIPTTHHPTMPSVGPKGKGFRILKPLRALGKGFKNFTESDALCKGFVRIRRQAKVLFGGKVWCPERLLEVVEEAELMEALAEQLEDDRLDDGAIEQDGNKYEPCLS
jgi:hypothetical protein